MEEQNSDYGCLQGTTYKSVDSIYSGEMAEKGQDIEDYLHIAGWCREDDEEFNNALMEQDIDAKLYMQTPNSPDVNLLDLGFFRAIQSFSNASAKNEQELIESEKDTYKYYQRHKMNHTLLTL